MSNRRWTPWANCNPSDWPRVQQMNQQLSRRRENLNTLKNALAQLHSFFLSFLNWMPQCVERRKWRANHQIQVQHTKWVQALFHRAMTAASKLSVMIGCAKNSFLLPTILSTLGKYKTLLYIVALFRIWNCHFEQISNIFNAKKNWDVFLCHFWGSVKNHLIYPTW